MSSEPFDPSTDEVVAYATTHGIGLLAAEAEMLREHGVGTEWHKGEGGDRLREQNERAVEMQRRAMDARRGK